MKRCAVGVFLLIFCCTLAGCGEGKQIVTGTVTFDGQPVKEGTVTFVKTEGTPIREGAIIREGSFEARVPSGKYRIEVNAQKVVGKRKQKGFSGAEEELDITEEMFPAKYNTKSELSEEIKSGTNSVKLELKSK